MSNRRILGAGSRKSLTKSEFSEGSDKSCAVYSLPRVTGHCKDDGPPTAQTSTKVHSISDYNIRKVEEVLQLKRKLWKYAKAGGRQLENQKKDLDIKLVGTRYNMEDRKRSAKEGRAQLLKVESIMKD